MCLEIDGLVTSGGVSSIELRFQCCRDYFKQTQKAAEAHEVSDAVLAAERKEWEKVLKLNTAWNEESASLR